ncbi:MAG TPA: TraU family protein [Candidatus Thiothrix moscowensis]|uniref:TraU family protein n=1 Tax=unclassified Thiothrix TaxID=2636184 RepID=UPI0025DD0D9D|nr:MULTISPECIES: TraU family protein [unclassified Thiothrix]HRJ52241.1 TraU family protein [Candidatus Thiothrix moscowensis]HRJ92556.1 TraU family protein [Candidatus Thiothrix moscowensis]
MTRRLIMLLLILVVTLPALVQANTCQGKFPNPLTDIYWKGIFPLRIGPLSASFGQEDYGDTPPLICTCPAPAPIFVRIGIGISFWEPARVAEVVKKPFCSPLLGGATLGDYGIAQGTNDASDERKAMYHAHYYIYPVLAWLNLLTSVTCVQAESFDMLYLTELDPLWQDDELNTLLSPEAALFANPVAQAACGADCVAATAGFSRQELFWCAGCQGSNYPMTGSSHHHTGGVESSTLMTERMLTKMHKQLLALNTSTNAAMCQSKPAPVVMKNQYKMQMLYPIPATQQKPQTFGRTTMVSGAGKEFPGREDFAYLIFRRRLCCAF